MRNILAAFLVLAATPRAHAAQEVAARLSAEFGGDSGLYATGATKNLLQGEFGYAHTVRSWSRGQLWVEGSWVIGARQDRLFSAFDTSLVAQQFTAGVRGTLPIKPWLVPQLRVGAGALVGTLHLSGLQSGAVDHTSAAFTGYALAGVQFLLPRPFRTALAAAAKRTTGVTAGLVVEAGYCYSTDLHYSIAPAASSSTVQMPSAPTELGSLSLSGALLRVGVLLRF